jgi:PTS system galactitol-specific IIA component
MVKPAAIDFFFDEDLILVKDEVQSRDAIISKLGNLLFLNGLVDNSYTQAVLERETIFPTGLQARVTGVAIPHTDTAHVLKPAIAIATLAHPIPFQMMGAPDKEVMVEIVIMLAVHETQLAPQTLSKVIFVLENDEALRSISQATTKTAIKNAMQEHILD